MISTLARSPVVPAARATFAPAGVTGLEPTKIPANVANAVVTCPASGGLEVHFYNDDAALQGLFPGVSPLERVGFWYAFGSSSPAYEKVTGYPTPVELQTEPAQPLVTTKFLDPTPVHGWDHHVMKLAFGSQQATNILAGFVVPFLELQVPGPDGSMRTIQAAVDVRIER